MKARKIIIVAGTAAIMGVIGGSVVFAAFPTEGLWAVGGGVVLAAISVGLCCGGMMTEKFFSKKTLEEERAKCTEELAESRLGSPGVPPPSHPPEFVSQEEHKKLKEDVKFLVKNAKKGEGEMQAKFQTFQKELINLTVLLNNPQSSAGTSRQTFLLNNQKSSTGTSREALFSPNNTTIQETDFTETNDESTKQNKP